MIIIYHAANSLDGNMIKSLLEHNNIRAFIQGDLLQGGAGELPAADLVTVSVADKHENKAKEIVAEWESASIIEEEANANLLDGVRNANS